MVDASQSPLVECVGLAKWANHWVFLGHSVYSASGSGVLRSRILDIRLTFFFYRYVRRCMCFRLTTMVPYVGRRLGNMDIRRLEDALTDGL